LKCDCLCLAVADDQGNIALQVVGGGGADIAGISLTVNVEVTNAESVHDLNGDGYQVGVDAGEGVIVEGATFGGEGYEGVSLGVGPGVGTPIGGSALATETATVLSVNIPDAIDSVRQSVDDVMSSLTED